MPRGARVLEAGAAGLATYGQGIEAGWTMVGYDFVPMAPASRVLMAGAAALPFRNDAFDGALFMHILEHLSPEVRADAISEAFRILRPGGALAGAVFGLHDVRAEAGRNVAPNTRERRGIWTTYFDVATLSSLLPPGASVTVRHVAQRWGLRERLLFLYRKPSDAAVDSAVASASITIASARASAPPASRASSAPPRAGNSF
ncbi:MAG: class I SAM-dependent methyltransferase [Thermoplasmatota archaeon]